MQATTSANYENIKLPDKIFKNNNNFSIDLINPDTTTSINHDTLF